MISFDLDMKNACTLAIWCIAGLLCGPVWSQSHDQLNDAEVHVYKRASGTDLKISIVYPENYRRGGRYPTIVFFYGGGWNGGTVQQFEPHCRYLASRGMIAMTAAYRVKSRNGTSPFESVMDARSALRWIKKNARDLGVHKRKIVAAGGSAGGHLALATATLDEINASDDDLSVRPMPAALVLFNPVANTMPEGYGFERLGKRARELSPYHHLDRRVPPTIIFHGDEDTTVPLSNVVEFCEKMASLKNRCELVVYEGQGHAFFNHGRADHKYYKLTVREMDRFLQSLGFLSRRKEIVVVP